MRRALSALATGLLFGAGLVVSGMTDPRNIVGFLDVTGAFNPSLAGVMVGAIAVHLTALRLLGARAQRGFATRSERGDRGPIGPRQIDGAPWIDARLVTGAAIFGVGWGLAGFCPGPAIVALGFGAPSAWGFVAAMIVGVFLGESAARWGVSESEAERGVSAC